MIIAVDFDQTVALYDEDEWKKAYVVKDEVRAWPSRKMRDYLRAKRRQGAKIFIYTSRWWGDSEVVERWLKKHKIPYDQLVLGRMLADLYLCDKSVNPMMPFWESDAERVLSWRKS